MKNKVFMALFLIFAVSMLNGFNLRDGERLVFDIRYGVVTAGEATLNLEKTNYNEQSAWRITSTAQSNSFFDKVFRVRDFIESIATYDDLYSLRFTKRLHEGNYRQHRIHFNYLSQNFSIYSCFNFKQGVFSDNRIEIPSNTFDILSAFYYARTIELIPGQTTEINVTVDGKSYNAGIQVLRYETIDTMFGRRRCIVIRPLLEGDAIFKQTDNIDVWLLDDEFKTPVMMSSKVIFGSFRATLKKVEIK